jgi:pimeloyl-ACP methyl ester carboxylesterase
LSAFDDLAAFLATRDDAEQFVAPTMRTQLLRGTGDRVFVLLHGLTASPPVWDAIAAALNARGATVISLRLPMHGHTDRLTAALRAVDPGVLKRDLCDVLDRVAKLGLPITLGGHSLGGTLSLYGAAEIAAVDRAIAIAPFLGISFFPHETHTLLVPLINALPNMFLWWDPTLRENQQPMHGYPRYPIRMLGTGLAIADEVYAAAGRKPAAHAIDLVLNKRETSVNNRSAQRLAARWRKSGGAIGVHLLDGLPPSHDVIEPSRPNSTRVRDALVTLFMEDHISENRTLIL